MQVEPRVLLVGPYEGDQFGSIERFTQCLERELTGKIPLKVAWPRRVFARFAPTSSAGAKWLGYVDKFLIFPARLRQAAAGADLIHYSDQSSAIHARSGSRQTQLLTCTDLLAIRSARGEFPNHRTRWTGRALQRLIAAGIRRCDYVACLSEATRRDLLRCVNLAGERTSVLPMGLHRDFHPWAQEVARQTVSRFVRSKSFILHVGGNQWYKNRRGVLEIYAALARSSLSTPDLVLVGTPLDVELQSFISSHDLRERVHCVTHCGDDQLAAFYSAAELLLFPSLFEGFGWPIVEAQACGCPVITTNRAPMSEVAGGAAELIDPGNSSESASAVAKVLSESSERRAARIDAGRGNAERYSTTDMIDAYVKLYRSLGAVRTPEAAMR